MKVKLKLYIKKLSYIALFLSLGWSSCSEQPENASFNGKTADINPEYSGNGTVIPYNIAPLNFLLNEEAKQFTVRFITGTDSFDINTKRKVQISEKKWKNLLEAHKGENLYVRIFAQKSSGWEQYEDLVFRIAEEPIDPYLAYRLIEPGYELWAKMGIYQRCLENFDETPILLNTQVGRNCMNCHSFNKNNPETMLFHMRMSYGGTMFVKDGEVKKVNTKGPDEISAGVYPRWHPDGRYVAFSVNSTHQSFHMNNENVLEVYDKNSDIILFDTKTDVIIADSIIHRPDRFETFPEWSPDGKYLYFCSAKATQMPQNYDSLRYDLLRVAFDAETLRFGNQVDTLLSSDSLGKSVALPRISPDGKYLIVCLTAYGTFPIWHHDNDLYQLNLETSELHALDEINSPDNSDSYHSWSSNGRWLIFSSRRIDGLYTRPFIAYFDENGQFSTPFLLPQKDPEYYQFLLKSYNIPEFITGKVTVSPQKFEKVAKKDS